MVKYIANCLLFEIQIVTNQYIYKYDNQFVAI